MTQLFCRESGHGSAETILFLHGGGVSGRMWERELDAHRDWHCLAPDLPGHGASAHLRPFTLAGSVAGLAQLIRERSPHGSVHVIAFSVGAVVALALAAREPDLVARLWLSGPTPRIGKTAARWMNALSRPLLAMLGRTARAHLVARSLGLPKAQIGQLRADLDRLTPTLVGEINTVVAEQNDLKLHSIPVLITVGAREIRPAQRRAQDLARSLDGARGYVVRNAGHAWSLEAPDLFDDVLRAWMQAEALPSQLEPIAI